MKKKFKVTLVVFLVVVLGCFSQVFAASNQNNKAKKIAELKRSIRLFDSTTIGDEAEIGVKNLDGTTNANQNCAQQGDQLLKPEVGWARYNDNNPKIEYIGSTWGKYNLDSSETYKGDYHQICGNEEPTSIIIKFKGTQFRLIGTIWNPYPQYAYISIDNSKEEGFDINHNLTSPKYQSVLYSKKGLDDIVHTVKITQKDNSRIGLFVDAVDIDSTGYLIDPSTTLTLNKYTDSLPVGRTDTLIATVTPDNVANKTVKWTSSDPTVVNVDANGKITALKAGTAIITAITTDGSNLKASCDVTVAKTVDPTPVVSNRATLTINMVNGSTKQYDLSEDELNSFLNWYNGMANPLSAQCYTFNNPITGPYLNNKDYIPFNKIDDFKVQEYTK